MRKANIALAMAAILILGGFTYLAIHSGIASQKLQMKMIKLQSTEQKLKSINIQYEKLDTQLKTESTTNKEKIEDLKAQEDKLRKDKAELEAKLQAKAAEKQRIADAAAATAKAAQDAAVPVAYAAEAPSYSGSHQDWMAAAGISPANYGYVEYIVSHESGWNPCSYNPGHSNCNLTAAQIGNHACGLGQQLPCGKWAGAWNDPIAALRAMNGYVSSHCVPGWGCYGGWSGAYSYWVSHGNY